MDLASDSGSFLSVLPSLMSAAFSNFTWEPRLLQVLIIMTPNLSEERVFRTLSEEYPIWPCLTRFGSHPFPWTNHCGQGMGFTNQISLWIWRWSELSRKHMAWEWGKQAPNKSFQWLLLQEGAMDVNGEIPLPPSNLETYIHKMDFNVIWQLWLVEKSSFLSQNPHLYNNDTLILVYTWSNVESVHMS